MINNNNIPVSILYKSIAGRYRPVSYPDGPIRPAIDLKSMLAGYLFIVQFGEDNDK